MLTQNHTKKIVIILVAYWVIRKVYFKLRYSKVNKLYGDALKNIHPSVRRLFREFLYRMTKRGYNVIITSSYRSFAKQHQLKLENSSNASVGYSYHNYGMALDLNLEKNGKYWRKADSIAYWEQTGILEVCNELKMRWGGTFKTYHDPVHVDVGQRFFTKELLERAYDQYGENPNDIIGNRLKLTPKMWFQKVKIDKKVNLFF